MIGSIHSDQLCPVCGGRFKDNHATGLECKEHGTFATKFKVIFGKVTRRFDDYTTALTFLSHLRVEKGQGTFDYRKYRVDSPLRFDIVSDMFISLKRKTCKSSTLRKYEQYNTVCCGYFSDMLVSHIDHKQLQLFIHSLEFSSYRVKCILDFVMELLRWCHDNGDIQKIPKRPVWKWNWGMKPIVNKDTQAAIVENIYEHEWHAVPRACIGIEFLCTYPKIRPSELRNVRECDIDYARGILTIRSPKESREPKAVQLIPEHLELIKKLPRGMPGMYFLRYDYPVKGRKVGDRFGKDYLYYVWRRACKRLGVQVDLYRGTKHSTITDWSRNYPLPLIKRASNVTKCIERYIQLGEDDVQQLYQEAKPNTKDSSSLRLNELV